SARIQRLMARRFPITTTAARRLLYPRTSHRLPSRHFHTTPSLAGSPFFDLTRLSASRESQHLSKEKGRPRTEFVPHLELLKSSEVTPFATKKERVGKTGAESHGETESKGTTGILNGRSHSPQEAMHKRERESRIYWHLLKDMMTTEAVLEGFKEAKGKLDGAKQGLLSAESTRTQAKRGFLSPSALELTEIFDEKISMSPEEIAKAVKEFPNLAFIKKQVDNLNEALRKAREEDPVFVEKLVTGGQCKTQASITNIPETSIATLIKELQATRSTLEKLSAAEQAVKKEDAKNKAVKQEVIKRPRNIERILLFLSLIVMGGIISIVYHREFVFPASIPEEQLKRRDRIVEIVEDETLEDHLFDQALLSRMKRWFWAS
ncbi:MAG: hypothetical protein L6R42_008802, partial [Xanthoria sp. 1 TBL-2021]